MSDCYAYKNGSYEPSEFYNLHIKRFDTEGSEFYEMLVAAGITRLHQDIGDEYSPLV